jgi:serine/threonine protein phosphatase PrpC
MDGLHFQHGPGWSACSARGSSRTHNSDAVAVDVSGECLAFAVADGVGALEASPLASAAAAGAAVRWARQRRAVAVDDIPALLTSVNDSVGETLRALGEKGATTLACIILSAGRAIIITVGDSEVLAVGGVGPAERLNELDHVPARPNMLLAWIDGKETLEPHIIALECLPHRLCLVTDGVVQALDYGEIGTLIRETEPAEAARALVLSARDHGASDDITALVLSAEVAKSQR